MGYYETQQEWEYQGDQGGGWWWGLFILISVIGILAYIHIPRFLRARGSGQYTACQSMHKNIGTALELYSTDNKGLYPASMTMLTPKYLNTIPTCPSGRMKTGGYAATYRVSQKPAAYTFYCEGVNHSNVGVGGNYPQYNSYSGLTPK